MKKRMFLFLTMMSIIISLPVIGSERVIYSLKIITDKQAEITLNYSDSKKINDIRVLSYLILADRIEVEYVTGSTMQNSNTMKLVLPEGKFPRRIILKEQRQTTTKLNDLPLDQEKKQDILFLYDQGIINGYPDGSFKPDNTVSRAEFATLVVKTGQMMLVTNQDTMFKDVANTFWAKDTIMTLATKEILLGRGNGLFDPNATITIGEVLTVLDRTFECYPIKAQLFMDKTNHWSATAYKNMYEQGIVKEQDQFVTPYLPDAKATRQQCATFLSRILLEYYTVKP